MIRPTCALAAVAVWLFAVPHTRADLIVGPGNVSVTAGDGLSFPLITVDLNAPLALGPGDYVASRFNYQFSLYDGFVTAGAVTPIVLVGGGTSFTPVAVGDTITYAGPTGFVADPFGGIDAFTLGSGATVYAGLYWDATYTGGPELRMPVGFLNHVGDVFNIQSGANPPVVGTPIGGGAVVPDAFSHRTYDFSISIESATAGTVVPEPPSLLLALMGGAGLLWGRRRWCRRPGACNHPTASR